MGLLNNIVCNRGKEAPGSTCACPLCQPRKPLASDQLQAQRLRRRLTARKPMATQIRKPRRRMRATLGAERMSHAELFRSPEFQRLMLQSLELIFGRRRA